MVNVKLIEWFDEHFYKVEILADKDGEVISNVLYLPSVTTKLQAAPRPFLARWRGDIGNREADLRVMDAGNKGSRIHYACLNVFLNGGAVIYNPLEHPQFTREAINELQLKIGKEVFALQNQDEMYQVEKFRKWIDIVKPEVLGNESTVYDLDNKEAGTMDLFLKIAEGDYAIAGKKPIHLPAGYYIADLKSGSNINDEAYYQVSAYAKMSESGEIKIAGNLIIHTNAKTVSGFTTHFRLGEQIEEDYRIYRHIASVWESQNKDLQPELFNIPNIITKTDLK